MPSQTSHSVTVAVAVHEPFMLLDGIPLGFDQELMLEFVLRQLPKADWQPAMQYCGPEPLRES